MHPSLPVKGVKDFTAFAKARPGKINYGSPGVGTVGHLATELFATQAGVKLNHVPYKGAALYTIDLLAGHIELAIIQFAGCAPLLQQGKLRALGATSQKRTPLLPDLPTIAEQGLAGFSSYNWNGMLAPAATPKAIVARIHEILAKQLATPENQQLFIGQGHETGRRHAGRICGVHPRRNREMVEGRESGEHQRIVSSIRSTSTKKE